MAFSFPALTKALTGAAIARRQGQDDAAEARRARRSESLQELILRSRNPQIVESEEGGFSLDPTRAPEAIAAKEEEAGQARSLQGLIERGLVEEGTELPPGFDASASLGEIVSGSITRAQEKKIGPTPPTDKETADLGLTAARTEATQALAASRRRPGKQDSALNKRLDSAVDDIRKFERDQAAQGIVPEPGRTQAVLDRIAKLHGFADMQDILRLQSQRGTSQAGEPAEAAPEPEPENEVGALLDTIINSNAPPDEKALAQQIVDSPEMSPEEKLELLQELAG